MNKIVTKWIEPYILLEQLKTTCDMKNFVFDGVSKTQIKNKFFNCLKEDGYFGLYMKNVNQFYLFKGIVDIETLLNLSKDDIKEVSDSQTVIDLVDMGRAEAGFIFNIS